MKIKSSLGKTQVALMKSQKKSKILEEFKSEVPVHKINTVFKKVNEYPIIKKELTRHPFHFENEPKKIETEKFNYLTFEENFIWLSNVINLFKDELNDFFCLQNKFYLSLFHEDYETAEEVINSIAEKFGISFWLLEKKTNVLQVKNGLEKQKDFQKLIADNTNVHFIYKYASYFFSLKSEFNVSTHNYDQEVQKYHSEYKRVKSQGITEYYQYLIYKFDLNYGSEYNYSSLMTLEEDLSIIDRYHSLIDVLTRLVLEKENDEIIKSENMKLFEENLEDLNSKELNILIRKFLNPDSKLYLTEEFEMFSLALDNYTFGNYSKVIRMSENIIDNNPMFFELYEIYAKSLLHLDRETNLKYALSNKIVKGLKSILSGEDNSSESYSSLLKISYQHSSSLWSWKLRNLVTNAYLGQKQALKYKISSKGAALSLSSHPQINIDLYSTNRLNSINNNFKEAHPENFTFELHEKIFMKDEKYINQLTSIPRNRKLDILAKIYQSENKHEECLGILQTLATDGNLINSVDIKCLIVDTLIEMSRLDEALTYTIDAYFENKNIMNKINLSKLVIGLEENIDLYITNISLPILFDLVTKYFDSRKEGYRNDIYEDFLIANNVKKPSELNFNDVLKINARWIYFLSKVCTINVMSNSIEFSTLEEVENERIYICQMLNKIDEANKEIYTKEIKLLTQRKMIQKGINKIHSSKIFVNVEGIKISLEKKMTESFNRYKSFGYSNVAKTDPNYFTIGENKVIIPGNDKWNLLINMINDIRESFVYSAEYGLDGYLSVGIRHGTLSGHLRGSIEKYNLITQVDSKIQDYSENVFWLDRLGIKDENQRKIVSKKFNHFSEQIDESINYLKNDLIQINSDVNTSEDNNHPEGLFDYKLRSAEMLLMDSMINENSSFDDFFDAVIEFLWARTDKNLIRIQLYLKKVFLENIKNIFDELIQSLKESEEYCNLTDVNSQIIKAKQDFSYSLEKVTSWFSKTQDTEIGDYHIELPIEIGLEMAMNIYNKKEENINKKFNISVMKLHERTFKGMVDISYILFENIFKHGGKTENIEINVDCYNAGDKIVIKCSNNLSDEMDIYQLNESLNKKVNEFKNDKGINMVSKEGGSGFYKIKKILSVDLGCNIDIQFKINEDDFFEIFLEVEGNEILV